MIDSSFNDIPLVSIQCMVYNHEPYLRQCLDGFVMQKTNFPFEAIVHDDASTDGSAAIIREYAEKYPDIIKPVYETENQYSKHNGSLRRAMDAAMHPDSKYVALCEGDDYWTDPNKLQMQVDCLEKQPTVGLVHTAARVYDQQTGELLKKLLGQPIASFVEELMINRVATLTTCFRKDLFMRYKDFYSRNCPKDWKMGDYPIWLFMTKNADSYFLSQPTGVYRLLGESASHSPNVQKLVDFELSSFAIQVFFAKFYHQEHLLKTLATNAVRKVHYISLNNDTEVNYDFWGIAREYGLEGKVLLTLRHYILKNRLLRKAYDKCQRLVY